MTVSVTGNVATRMGWTFFSDSRRLRWAEAGMSDALAALFA